MNKVLQKKMTGHTVLEAVVYVTILAGLLILVVNTLLIVGGAYRTVTANRAINRSLTSAFDRMTHEIRSANSIQGSSVFGADPSTLVLDTNGTLITFGVSGNSLTLTEGSGTPSAITGETVTVTSFIVDRIVTGRGDGARITLGLESGENDSLRSAIFTTSVLLRGSY